MTKRFKKIISLSFLIVFLLGYIGTIVPSSVVASLLDIKVYAEGEEEEEEPLVRTLDQVELENEYITESINSTDMIPFEWTDAGSFVESDLYNIMNVMWEDENGEAIDDQTSLTNSHTLYGFIEVEPNQDDILYEFNTEMSECDVTLNGEAVSAVSFDGETYMLVTIEVNVIHSGEAREIETIRVGSAALDYLATETPDFTARSLESSYYEVSLEIFEEVDSTNFLSSDDDYNTEYNANPDFYFQGGKTYTYTIWIKPVDADSAYITDATKIEINGVVYNLVLDGEGINSEIDGDDIKFYGVPNIVIAGAQVPDPETINVNVLDYDEYDSGTFVFENGSAYININGDKYTGPLTNGNIVIEGNSANIEVVATPASGYESTIYIDGNQASSAIITANSTIDISFSEIINLDTYTLVFETYGGTPISPIYNLIEGAIVDLSTYVTTKNDFRFEGWYTEPEFQNKVTSIEMDSTRTVYAKWTSLKGEVTIIYNSPEGLGAISVNDSTLTASGNSVFAYNTSEKKNTITVSPLFAEGYTITSIVVTDANEVVTNAGPGTVNDDLSLQVDGSTSYNIVVTIEKLEEPETYYNMTYNFPGLVASYTPESITNEEDFVTTLSVDPELELMDGIVGYHLPASVAIMIGDTMLIDDNYSFDDETGVLTIPKLLINDDITIYAPVISLIEKPTLGTHEFTYDGQNHSPVINGYNTFMTKEEDTQKTNAGNYTIVIGFADATFAWEGFDAEPIEFNWTIYKAQNNLSVTMDSWLISSTPAEPVIIGNHENGVPLIQYKERSAADDTYISTKPNYVGEFTVKVVVPETANYLGGSAYADFEIVNDNEDVVVDLPQLEIKKYIYTGEEITPEFIYSDKLINVTNIKGTELGKYIATFSLMNSNYLWEDETTEDKTIEWEIVLDTPEVKTKFRSDATYLYWESVPGAIGYQVYECNNKGAKCSKLASVVTTNYTHTKRKFGTTYYYKVRSYATVENKNVYSAYTDLISIKANLNAPVVTASTNRYQEVKLSWAKESGAEKYYVYKCNSEGGSCKELGKTTKTTYTDKKAKEGANSYYKVRAYKAKKYSAYSELATGFRVNDDLVVTAKSTGYLTNTITIQNKAGATKYEVYKSTDNKKFTLFKTVTIDPEEELNEDEIVVVDNKKLKFNKKTYYKVRAYNGVNYTAYAAKNVTATFLDAPAILASGFRYQEVKITWEKVNGAEKYYVYKCDEEGNSCKELGNTTKTSYADKKAKEGASTYYKVKAYKAKKYSKYSNLAQGFRQPDNLDVTVKNTDYVTNTITILRLYGAYKYEIQRSTDNKKWTTIKTFEYENDDAVDESMVYVDAKLSYNKKYYYRVRAHNGQNYTAYTAKNVTTTNLKAPEVTTAGTINHPTLTVTAVSKATGYEFYHSTDNVTWTKEQKGTKTKFTKQYDEGSHYYKVRAYRVDGKKTYYGNYTYVTEDDFK